jgi:uncharacterized protein YceH (UPF0502 family)
MPSDNVLESSQSTTPRWHPLEAIDRRVLGVLIEKAKTTPDTYPLSLNALKAGCNQKSNRFPQMQLDEDQIEESLERLRKAKAVAVIQGDGRVEKYRHLAYEWLGVGKVELAIMAELLLRGAQTIGELRARASRMEPIKSQEDLGPLLQGLQAKSLIVYLTPPGRGAVLTHSLYLPRELEKVRREHGIVPPPDGHPLPRIESEEQPSIPAATPAVPMPTEIDQMQDAQTAQLREEVAHLRSAVAAYRDETAESIAALRRELQLLREQLGG